jgi:thiol-disulfide isomerase/thioredoxin
MAEIPGAGMGCRPGALYGDVTAGVLVGIVVLIGASAFGLARRRRDGKLRASRRQRPAARQRLRVLGVGEVLPGLTRQRQRPAQRERRITEADLGHPLGPRATLLQFSSSFCAPCRATRQVLADVASSAEGIAHVEIDVADRVDLVRVLDVRRTPTTFLLDSDGRVASRASGPPRKADVLAALGEVA